MYTFCGVTPRLDANCNWHSEHWKAQKRVDLFWQQCAERCRTDRDTSMTTTMYPLDTLHIAACTAQEHIFSKPNHHLLPSSCSIRSHQHFQDCQATSLLALPLRMRGLAHQSVISEESCTISSIPFPFTFYRPSPSVNAHHLSSHSPSSVRQVL